MIIFVKYLKRKTSVLVAIVLSGRAANISPTTPIPVYAYVPPQETRIMSDSVVADVLGAKTAGELGAYQIEVEISSADAGCDQYTDWWEVLDEGGQLLYRRVLLHSHVSEQPFTRSGGPMAVDSNTTVIIRAHMNNTGYGVHALKGSVASGFEYFETGVNFSAEVETHPPLPDGCAF